MADTLKLKTQSTRGVMSAKETKQNEVYAIVEHSENKYSEVAVGVYKQKGGVSNTLINITFDDGAIWGGSFEDLKRLLKPTIENGYVNITGK